MNLKSVLFLGTSAISLFATSAAMAANCTISLSNSNTYPYTVNTANAYVCITNNISKNIPDGGKLLIINADNVTVDLQGNELRNSPIRAAQQDSANNNFGIFTNGTRSNLTVKNGRISGFNGGINFLDSGTGYTTGTLIDGVKVSQFTYDGIRVDGKWNIVRNSQVIGNGNSGETGILTSGSGNTISDNFVKNIGGESIRVRETNSDPGFGDVSLIEKNVVIGAGPTANIGIEIDFANALVVNNRIQNVNTGIYLNGDYIKYRDNLTLKCTTPFSGTATDAGGNN